MSKYIFGALLSLFLYISFLPTVSLAIQKTPVITFKNLGRDQLLPVVGYPNDKPTIIFYSQLPFVDNSNNHTISFPKIYRTDHLSSAMTVGLEQFEDLSKTSNIKDIFLINALPLPDASRQHGSILRALSLEKIIWFDKTKSYYALGIMHLHAYAQGHHDVVRKIVILESRDGQSWSINNDNSQTIPVSTYDVLNRIDILGCGPESNPTLVLLNNEKIYYKHLKLPDAVWNISKFPAVAYNLGFEHDQIIRAYKDKLLLLKTVSHLSSENTLKNMLTQNYFISDDGENWKQLVFNSSESNLSEVIRDIAPGGTGQLIATLMELTQNADGSYAAKEMREKLYNYPYITIGEIVIDQDHNRISIPKKISLSSALGDNTYAGGISNIIYVPSNLQGIPGNYYVSFYKSNSIGIDVIAAAESLEGLSKVNLSSINYGERLFDSPPEDGLVNFNDQPYFMASLDTMIPVDTNSTETQIDAIFYHIDGL